MRIKLLCILAGFILESTLNAESILIIDSLEKVKSCTELADEIKPASVKSSKNIKILDYKKLHIRIKEAQEKFYKLEIDESSKILDEVTLDISDAIITGGSLNEIYNLFQQSLTYKLLILLSKKEENKAVELLKEYLSILSSIPVKSKQIHPSLKSFMLANLDSARNSILTDKEIAKILKKALGSKKIYSFDGLDMMPDVIFRSKHLLLIEKGDGEVRSMIRNFEVELNQPILLGRYGNHTLILSMNEEAFNKTKSFYSGSEMLICREEATGLVLTDGKMLTKEEALMRNVKVEIVNTENVESKKEWYENWWIYAAGGTVVAAVITSIILINTDEKGGEFYRDRIPIR